MIRALLLDVGGTLLHPAEPVARTYARVAAAWGHAAPEQEVASRFRAVFRDLDEQQVGDGRGFWRAVVRGALAAEALTPEALEPIFEALYAHYLCPDAWSLAPGARETLQTLHAEGLKLAVVSNWDTRLRPLLQSLGLAPLLQAQLISGECGLEKPDPALFAMACAQLGVRPAEALHLGDSRRKDLEAARAAGCQALLWGEDLHDFAALPARLSGPW
ncbi:MAG: HAD-IA family hydrolase [Alphaproteobacteria bacterium]|nr:HAD-IA family hydrolase [Alphaproteobacteria bacterium]